MINVLAIKGEENLIKFCSQNNIPFVANCGVTVARDGEEVLGFCAYILDDISITVTHLEPQDDIMLADGILRSALHVADFRGIENALYSDSAPYEIFQKLGFIKDQNERTLKIEKLHESCCSCNN